MDYTPLILEKIREIKRLSPDLTFGQIIYSMLRKPLLRVTPADAHIGWLLEVSDFNLFNSLARLQQEENEYKEEENQE